MLEVQWARLEGRRGSGDDGRERRKEEMMTGERKKEGGEEWQTKKERWSKRRVKTMEGKRVRETEGQVEDIE